LRQLPAAVTCARQSVEILEEIGLPPNLQILPSLALLECLRATDIPAAVQFAAQAHKKLEARASSFSDPIRRQRFRDAPGHKRVFELCTELLGTGS
jgi:hypothetical protein